MSLLRIKSDGTGFPFGNKLRRIGGILAGIKPSDVAIVGQLDALSDRQTQLTSITTGVVSNSKKGMITTVSATTVASGSSIFTVTNSFASTTANVKASVMDYSGTPTTNGIPDVYVRNRTATGFDIVITNSHPTNALAGVLTIGYEILN